MKALTLTQPYASLIELGVKPVETRSWKTAHRGDIAIHAAKGFPSYEKELCNYWPYSFVFAKHFGFAVQEVPEMNVPKRLPVSSVVAIARLVDCVSTSVVVNDPSLSEGDYVREVPLYLGETGRISISSNAYAFGDFSQGRWAWILDDIRPLPEPVPAKGALSLWDWDVPADVQAWLDEQGEWQI